MSKTDGIFYSYNNDNFFAGQGQARKDKLQSKIENKDVFVLPALATWKTPGTIPEGKRAIYSKSSDTWANETIPKTEDDIIVNVWGIKESTLEEGKLKSKSQSAINTESEVVAWGRIRAERDKLLKDSDFSQLADVSASVTEAKKTAWVNYRQSLRDLTETITDPKKPVNFPSKPI